MKWLNWMKEGAHAASWLQCARRVHELIGEPVPQMRNWKKAALPCQQAVNLAHSNMVDNEGVDAIKIAGTSWETLLLSCSTKLQKAIALKIRPTRANNKSHCRGQPTQWSCSMGQSCASRGKKNTMLDQPYGRGSTHTSGLTTRTAELHLQSLPRKSIKTLRERDLGVGGSCAWLCKSCSKHWAQPHPRLVGRSPGELRRPSRRGTVRQRVRTGKKECVQMSERSQTWEDIRHTST